MNAKWQKAKIIKDQYTPNLIGKEIWAKVGLPEAAYLFHINGSPLGEGRIIECNFMPSDPHADGHGYEPDQLEWLARGPEDFAEHVEMVPYDVWSNPTWEGCVSTEKKQ